MNFCAIGPNHSHETSQLRGHWTHDCQKLQSFFRRHNFFLPCFMFKSGRCAGMHVIQINYDYLWRSWWIDGMSSCKIIGIHSTHRTIASQCTCLADGHLSSDTKKNRGAEERENYVHVHFIFRKKSKWIILVAITCSAVVLVLVHIRTHKHTYCHCDAMHGLIYRSHSQHTSVELAEISVMIENEYKVNGELLIVQYMNTK